MTFTEKIVVAKISAKVKHSGKVIKSIYQMKSSVVAIFSVILMYSVNHMSIKVMLNCNLRGHTLSTTATKGEGELVNCSQFK